MEIGFDLIHQTPDTRSTMILSRSFSIAALSSFVLVGGIAHGRAQQDRGVGHGFGLGNGTSAKGWITEALRFWEMHLDQPTRIAGES